MRTDLFDFDLPPDRIALRPVSPRDAAKLLVVRPGGAPVFEDRGVRDLPDLLQAGVLFARITSERSVDNSGEFNVHQPSNDDGRWPAHASPAQTGQTSWQAVDFRRVAILAEP